MNALARDKKVEFLSTVIHQPSLGLHIRHTRHLFIKRCTLVSQHYFLSRFLTDDLRLSLSDVTTVPPNNDDDDVHFFFFFSKNVIERPPMKFRKRSEYKKSFASPGNPTETKKSGENRFSCLFFGPLRFPGFLNPETATDKETNGKKPIKLSFCLLSLRGPLFVLRID